MPKKKDSSSFSLNTVSSSNKLLVFTSVHVYCAFVLTTELRPCAGIMIEKYFTQLQRLFFFQCQIDFLTYSLGATVRVYEVKLSRKYPLETRKVGRWPVYEGVVV